MAFDEQRGRSKKMVRKGIDAAEISIRELIHFVFVLRSSYTTCAEVSI